MTIQISKTSWHYRLVASTNSDTVLNRGLCVYVRKVMSSIFWVTLFVSVISAIAIYLIAGPIAFWLAYFDVIEMTNRIRGLGITSQGLWLVAGLVTLVNMLKSYLKERRWKKGPKPAKPASLFSEYIKAKKQKVCPNIEFV